jgi:hypothetical protein
MSASTKPSTSLGMIKNTAFGAALMTFQVVAWLAGELTFLAPYKARLFRYGLTIGGSVLLLFLHLCALYYGIACWLFLRDAGRKLTHIDRQLGTAEGLHEDLRTHIAAIRR